MSIQRIDSSFSRMTSMDLPHCPGEIKMTAPSSPKSPELKSTISLTFHQISQRGSSPKAGWKMGVPAVIDVSKEARPDGEVWESLSAIEP